jgi:hypothetical protein
MALIAVLPSCKKDEQKIPVDTERKTPISTIEPTP